MTLHSGIHKLQCAVPRTSAPLQSKTAKKPLMRILLGALASLACATTLTLAYKTLFLLIEGAQSFHMHRLII